MLLLKSTCLAIDFWFRVVYMVKDAIKRVICELTSLNGVSGFEQQVVKRMAEKLQPVADQVEIDNFGNIYAIKEGTKAGPTLMVAAHSDEVGAIVNEILSNGLLRFKTIGVVSDAILPATRVKVADINGVIGSIPAHLEMGAAPGMINNQASLSIDVGAASAEEVRAWGIEIGTPVAFAGEVTDLGNPDRICGRAIDDRVGCAIILRTFHELNDVDFAGKVVGVITVQEETTMSGARIAANRLRPDCAIAVDTVPASDTLTGGSVKFAIGRGPVIQLGDGVQKAFVGSIAHPAMKQVILQTAKDLGIPVQLAAEIGQWTTDAAAIHASASGVPTGYISIARRYAHSPVEVMDLNDAANAVRLLKGVIHGLGDIDLRFVSL